MAKKKNKEVIEELDEQVQNQENTGENTEKTSDDTPDSTQNEASAAKEELSQEEILIAENSELKDKFRRLFAEFDNFKKRKAKERIDYMKTAGQDVIIELLPVLDDFERAIKANEEASGQAADENDGFILIHKKLMSNLERKGLVKMEARGNDFDADLHEAIAEIPGADDQKGKIIDVVEEGYLLNEKIIRHAKVVVGR